MAVVLFIDKKDCCGCGACENICPKNAIKMEPDQVGFLYPVIDHELCIECGACKKVCRYQNEHKLNEPQKVFAAVNKDEKQRMLSASGGVFSAIATKILKEGGVVFGATMSFDNNYANPHHIGIESMNELPQLQGSKYVQSRIEDTYKQAKGYLENGRTVLFSGTPCQIDGLYGFLKKYYENLITIDIICHGVPNEKFFNGYLQEEKRKRGAKSITDYAFRDKRKGWGMNGRINYIQDDGLNKCIFVPGRLTSYYTLFLDGKIYRKSCYFCKYATQKRASDLTIGDFWGIETEHPELLENSDYVIKKGISCLLANSDKGILMCQNAKDILQLHESSFEKVSHKNKQLIKPMGETNERTVIMRMYETKGYAAVEKWFEEKYKKQIIMRSIYYMLPTKLQLCLKHIFKG